jgi:hypothetical protein
MCEKGARELYEDFYCARGDMENRIKEQQLGLFADRTSTSWMRSNQLRLYFSSFAYILMHALRRLGLEGTELAKAQCDTIRLKLFKIGAQIQVTVRKADELAQSRVDGRTWVSAHSMLKEDGQIAIRFLRWMNVTDRRDF